MNSTRVSRRRARSPVALACGVAMVACAMFLPVWGGSSDRCVSVQVPGPIVLPDGSNHPGGTLTLCHVRDFSPVSGVHRLAVDRMPVCLVLSRRVGAETPLGAPPRVLFYRTADGVYRLVGYSYSAGRKVSSFFLSRPESRAAVNAATVPPSVGQNSLGGSPVLLLASVE